MYFPVQLTFNTTIKSQSTSRPGTSHPDQTIYYPPRHSISQLSYYGPHFNSKCFKNNTILRYPPSVTLLTFFPFLFLLSFQVS